MGNNIIKSIQAMIIGLIVMIILEIVNDYLFKINDFTRGFLTCMAYYIALIFFGLLE